MFRRVIPMVAALALAAPVASAASPKLGLHAKIYFKLVTYDVNLPADQALTFGVFFSGDKAPVDAVFEKLAALKIKGRVMKLDVIPYGGVSSVASYIETHKPYGLFFDSELPDGDIKAIAALATKHKLLVYSTNTAHVAAGLGAGLDLTGSKPTIVINGTATAKAGRTFQGAILNVATVLK